MESQIGGVELPAECQQEKWKGVACRGFFQGKQEADQLHKGSLCLVNKNLSALFTPVRDSNKQFSPIRNKQTGPRARGSRVTRSAVVMIGVLLLEDIDKALAADHVNPAFGYVIYIRA